MKCIYCGQELPASAIYCMTCGKKQTIRSDNSLCEEDEDKFALHYEYYGGFHGSHCSPGIKRYSCHQGTVYHYPEGGSAIRKYSSSGDVSYITCDLPEGCGIQVNNAGIFLEYSDRLILLDEYGRKKAQAPLTVGADEECSSFYIYDHKIFVLERKKCRHDSHDEMDFRVREMDIEHKTLRTLWSYEAVRPKIDEHLRQSINSYGKRYKEGSWVNNAEARWLWSLELSPVYANSQQIIFYFRVSCENHEGYSAEADSTISLNLKSETWSLLQTGGALASGKTNVKIFSFDMLNNRMWYYFNGQAPASFSNNTLYSAPIGKTSDIKESAGKWEFDSNSFWDILNSPVYFDGAHLYNSECYYTFYSYDPTGRRGEWNRSGHGCADQFCILGDWVKPTLESLFHEEGGECFYPHSVDLPAKEACLVIPPEDIKNARRITPPGMPGSGRGSSDTRPSGGSGEKAAAATLGSFRQLVRTTGNNRETALAFRKSLPDRWDYNAAAGILAGTRKRHTTGMLREMEQNLGIGQGDNHDSVTAKLREKGLEDIYSKYETDTQTSLAAVEQEILAAVPEYGAIIDFINQTFL